LSFVPLTQAVASGDANAVTSSLASGADVNERNAGGQTALILATIFGHTHLISVLLNAGADPQLRDNLGLNALDWAQRRGSSEAFDVLNSRGKSETQAAPTRRERSTEPDTEKPKPASEADRSRRWLAGLQQRIAEQGGPRDLPDGPNIFRTQAQLDPAPQSEPEPEIQSVAEVTEAVPVEQPAPPPPEESAPPPHKSSGRKRCPKCNAIYHSPLVAYCAHHIVPLVDDDDSPIISQPAPASPVMFWMIIIITLSGSVVIASLISSYIYNSHRPAASAAAAQPTPNPVQKGVPAVGRELTGRVVSLPVAECPLNGQEPIPGTVVVKVEVDKNGKVKNARASGGDWLLRGAATEAAIKSTFSPEKLRNRETESTITYTFEP
jgi:ankyrin repeat protein/TonB-like protein